MSDHTLGEPFVLIEAGALQEIVLSPSAIGTSASVVAQGLADQDAAPIERIILGEGMRPPSPIDLVGAILSDGSLSLSWERRSRLGWMWPATSEPPLGESVEKYAVTVEGAAALLSFEPSRPELLIPADALAGMTGTITISAVQVGDYASSRPATLVMNV